MKKDPSLNKTLAGSIIAFIIATSCCWIPALLLSLGITGLANALSENISLVSSLFFFIGSVLVLYSGYLYYKKSKPAAGKNIVYQSTITCPECGFSKTEEMPANACQYFYECSNCHSIIKPNEGDCCVYCSFGDINCPPIQEGVNCC